MGNTVGSSFRVARPELTDRADIENAFLWFWEGHGNNNGAEDHLVGLDSRISILESLASDDPNVLSDSALYINANALQLVTNKNTGAHMSFRGDADSTSQYTFPAGSDTVTLINAEQILSQKTLISPSIINFINFGATAYIKTDSFDISQNVSLSSLAASTDNMIDEFSLTMYRSGEYIISASSNSGGYYYVCKILIVHDGTIAYISPYGEMATGNLSMTFSVDIADNKVKLFARPTLASTIKVNKVLIKP